MSIPLLTTKFFVPPARPNLVSRPRLLEQLNTHQSQSHRIGLISSAAGSGKTTLVVQWLATQEQVVPDEYAIVGHSRGGELALLLASRYPQIKATVALAPSSVVFPGSPQGFFDLLAGQHSAWSYQGKPLPFVPWPISLKNAPSLVTFHQRQMFEQALSDERAVNSAIIPVENANGPILCVSATQDEIWPSGLMCDQIVDRLTHKGFLFHYDHISHDHTHGWCGLEDCWEEVVGFLDEYFK